MSASIHRHGILFCACIAAAVLAMSISGFAAPSDDEPKADKADENQARAVTLYKEGVKLADQWKYAEALPKLQKANELKPDDPDILNMLAYVQRNRGQLEKAIANYHKALELRPRFPEAREYLGEAYIQGAIDQIKTLDRYGSDAAKAKQQVIAKLREAASMYEPEDKAAE